MFSPPKIDTTIYGPDAVGITISPMPSLTRNELAHLTEALQGTLHNMNLIANRAREESAK